MPLPWAKNAAAQSSTAVNPQGKGKQGKGRPPGNHPAAAQSSTAVNPQGKGKQRKGRPRAIIRPPISRPALIED